MAIMYVSPNDALYCKSSRQWDVRNTISNYIPAPDHTEGT